LPRRRLLVGFRRSACAYMLHVDVKAQEMAAGCEVLWDEKVR
jgi:hypothetical protein